MGSCISKCKPKMIKQPPLFDFNNLVQDKLVVIPQPRSPLLPTTTTTAPSLSLNNKISPYPPSPSPSSSSSISSFTCLSSTTTTSTNTSFSTASSRSPISSHHYFRSPYNQTPHLLRINSLRANAFPAPVKPVSPIIRHPSPQRVSRSTPQKRVRPASPSPIRQKSFRKEVLHRPLSSSPSPSRRFSGEKCRVAVAPINASPFKNGSRPKSRSPARGSVMKKEITCIHRISSKIDEVAVREAIGDLDSAVGMEDIDNPLISLDCFIFL